MTRGQPWPLSNRPEDVDAVGCSSGTSDAAREYELSASPSMTLAHAASSCLGDDVAGSLYCKVLITLAAKTELSVKAGDAGRGIPRLGGTSALFMKTLIARCAVAIRSSRRFSRLNAIVCAGHSL